MSQSPLLSPLGSPHNRVDTSNSPRYLASEPTMDQDQLLKDHLHSLHEKYNKRLMKPLHTNQKLQMMAGYAASHERQPQSAKAAGPKEDAGKVYFVSKVRELSKISAHYSNELKLDKPKKGRKQKKRVNDDNLLEKNLDAELYEKIAASNQKAKQMEKQKLMEAINQLTEGTEEDNNSARQLLQAESLSPLKKALDALRGVQADSLKPKQMQSFLHFRHAQRKMLYLRTVEHGNMQQAQVEEARQFFRKENEKEKEKKRQIMEIKRNSRKSLNRTNTLKVNSVHQTTLQNLEENNNSIASPKEFRTNPGTIKTLQAVVRESRDNSPKGSYGIFENRKASIENYNEPQNKSGELSSTAILAKLTNMTEDSPKIMLVDSAVDVGTPLTGLSPINAARSALNSRGKPLSKMVTINFEHMEEESRPATTATQQVRKSALKNTNFKSVVSPLHSEEDVQNNIIQGFERKRNLYIQTDMYRVDEEGKEALRKDNSKSNLLQSVVNDTFYKQEEEMKRTGQNFRSKLLENKKAVVTKGINLQSAQSCKNAIVTVTTPTSTATNKNSAKWPEMVPNEMYSNLRTEQMRPFFEEQQKKTKKKSKKNTGSISYTKSHLTTEGDFDPSTLSKESVKVEVLDILSRYGYDHAMNVDDEVNLHRKPKSSTVYEDQYRVNMMKIDKILYNAHLKKGRVTRVD